MKLLFALDVILHPADITGARRGERRERPILSLRRRRSPSAAHIGAAPFIKNYLIFGRRAEEESAAEKMNGRAVYIWAPRYIMFVQC